MFNKPVVFVIGAGASYEYALPLGSGLKDEIATKVKFRFEHGSNRLVHGDPDLLDHIRRHVTARSNEMITREPQMCWLLLWDRSFLSMRLFIMWEHRSKRWRLGKSQSFRRFCEQNKIVPCLPAETPASWTLKRWTAPGLLKCCRWLLRAFNGRNFTQLSIG